MKCSSVREKLFDYIDGALKGSDLQAVEDHLKSCSECRHELEKVQQLDARLQQEIPAYVESIEPAPAFLNRLKSLDLEPEASPGPISNMLNSFFSIFEEHRMAFGTGLAVLIMIAIGLSIPTMTQDEERDSAPMIAEATPPDSREYSATQAPTEESMMMGESSNDMNKTAGEGPSFTWDDSAEEMPTLAPAPIPEPTPTPTPVPTPAPPTPTIDPTIIADVGEALAGGGVVAAEDEDYYSGSADVSVSTDKEPMEDPATIIAINDEDVMAIIEGTFLMEVLYDITEEDYICDGPTVAITLNEVDPPGNLIYVCVDLENEEVVEIKIWGE
ncbi:MAG: zf-HC2 domain-containing protein [Chloroflexi bacterium]|nr:zf-HC2 domain-containing protein [Chloroflexota bacterium]